ncbi:MAG: NtaA/DmoA family FMN-dependent monooxygenase [Xanthobacteraceae bacterium]
MPKKMHLGIDLSFTHTDGRWRTPGSWSHRVYPDLTMFEDFARLAERGCLDMIFFGDGTGIPATWRGTEEAGARWGIQWPRQDMSPYITAMSRATKHVGFGLTYSSTFMHPFYVARLLNSLDVVTGGRMAFNVITSTRRSDAANYGFDELMEHNSRYDRMEEFVDVCKALWHSVEPDAFIWDRESGMVCDPDKIHPINHSGHFFKVRGPLSTVPSPQICPVLIQAGGSPRGIRASAHFADHIFAASPPRTAKIKHRKALDEALVAEGRDPASVGILFSTNFIVGHTESEANAKKEMLLDLLPEEGVGAYLSHNIGYDFSKIPDPVCPAEVAAEIAASQASPVSFVSKLAEQLGANGTIAREEFFKLGTRVATGYDRAVAGTPAQLADFMEQEFEATGCRGGFMISHPYTTPRDMMDIVDFLIPELQRRGRFRTKYEGATLRENLAAH